ncbi:MAG: phage integrase N-terminal SAM-like domain-containing protein [Anaerolineae bacterium]|nr:phage integrase N-terminal SAM-like domain-containing protein [Anaerolineae bacterium]
MTQRPKKLLDQVRDAMRLKHYAYSTDKTYVYWAKRFVLYHHKQHPREMAEKEISEFLTYLAVEEHLAASTQNQALSALLFLYREVLRKHLDLPLELVWAKRPKRLPTVLTKEEVQQVIGQLTGVHRLIVQLLYGSGLRLMECLRLQVEDLDSARRPITVRDGKEARDRERVIPTASSRRSTRTSRGSKLCAGRTWPRAMLPGGSGRRLLHSAPGERARQAPVYHMPAESASASCSAAKDHKQRSCNHQRRKGRQKVYAGQEPEATGFAFRGLHRAFCIHARNRDSRFARRVPTGVVLLDSQSRPFGTLVSLHQRVTMERRCGCRGKGKQGRGDSHGEHFDRAWHRYESPCSHQGGWHGGAANCAAALP